MVTAILILLALAITFGLVFMGVQMARGSLSATVWWVFGGPEVMLNALAEIVSAILKSLSE